MKIIQSPNTELWHILPVYIMGHCDLDPWLIFTKIGSRDRELVLNIYTHFEIYRPLRFWNMRSWNADFAAELLGNRRCLGNHFVPPKLGVVPMLILPKHELDWTAHHWVIAIFNWIRYVMLWPWPFTLELCHVMPLRWSISVPSFNQIGLWLTVPELGRLQFSIDRQLKVPIFTFFGDKGVKFQTSSF